jgi:hypothetical protein
MELTRASCVRLCRSLSLRFLALLVIVCASPAIAGAAQALCGDLDLSGAVSATDALLLLKKAVGQAINLSCPCEGGLCGDLDASGSVAASDALLLLKRAVGQNVTVHCPPCSSTTTLGGQTTTTIGEPTTTTTGGTTTTTLAGPAGCGNGVRDGAEECERLDGCESGQQCTAQCTCEPIDDEPPTSQDLIAQALAAGDIDYPTSLQYRVWALFQAPELPEQFDGAGSSGEDTALFFEIAAARATLPPAIESAVAPYLGRPTDPASIYSSVPSSSLTTGVNEELPPQGVACPDDGTGKANWGFFETEHFVVWTCVTGVCSGGKNGAFCDTHADCDTTPEAGDGICDGQTSATRRLVAGTVAEEAYAKMTAELGPPRADAEPSGPQPTDRIDIYILRPNECRPRGDRCKPVDDFIAAAVAVAPCDRAAGPFTSSGYVLLNADRIPPTAPASEASKFRSDLVHELFHVYEFGLNLEAMGYTCAEGKPAGKEPRISWLMEASAEWASFGFFPQDDAARRTTLFSSFQRLRDPTVEGLHATDGLLPYEAGLYLQFLQQEAGDISPPIGLWTTSQPVRSRAAFNNHLNQISSFRENFREFEVRDFNRALPGDPINPKFADLDEARTRGLSAHVASPPERLEVNRDDPGLVKLAPLFGQFEHFVVKEDVRWVRVDLSDVENFGHLDLDAIEHVGSTWRREKVDGAVYEFCRDDDDRDVDEFFLVISNHDLDIDGKADGVYRIKTKAACPSGWSGTITYVETVDIHKEYSDLQYDFYRSDSHFRNEQHWAVVQSVEVDDDPFDPYDELTLSWRASGQIESTIQSGNDQCSFSQSTITASGSANGTDVIAARAEGNGDYSLRDVELEPNNEIDATSHEAISCADGGGFEFDQPVVLGYDAIAYRLGNSTISPTDQDANHYVGELLILHTEDPQPGGVAVFDQTMRWDLHRNPKPAPALRR